VTNANSSSDAATVTVRTRFAPSPTGYLHIGGARTALFSWLLARKHLGSMVLRIEDTDRTRSAMASTLGILEDLVWLGLNWDEGPSLEALRSGVVEERGVHGPYFQSCRNEIYAPFFNSLLSAGRAYFSWTDGSADVTMTDEHTSHFVRPQRLITDEALALREARGQPIVIRFVSPQTPISVRDMVLGETTFPTEAINDFIIRKSDGFPTYHFAVVVDDHLMGITHVIRAQEHFNNTPKHIALQHALSFDIPKYAHLPLVLNQAGEKLSKRAKDRFVRDALRRRASACLHTPSAMIQSFALYAADTLQRDTTDLADVLSQWLTMDDMVLADVAIRSALLKWLNIRPSELPEIDVHDFRSNGYLPEVLLNYIALLGWSTSGDKETFSLSELTDAFSLSGVRKSNARFDRKRLRSFNARRIGALISTPIGVATLRSRFKDFLRCNPDSPLNKAQLPDEMLDTMMTSCAGFATFRELEEKWAPLILPSVEVSYSETMIRELQTRLDERLVDTAHSLSVKLQDVCDWSPDSVKNVIASLVAESGVPMTDVAALLRGALTGSSISPPINLAVFYVGKAPAIERLSLLSAKASTTCRQS
jgi:glutamyl-tRNA synthetase